jgi:hypothetical protein
MKRTMRKLTGILLALAAVTAVCSCSTPRDRAGRPIDLFNGKDLAGWRCALAEPQVGINAVWSVRDGVLSCAGTPIGVLYAGPEVTDFRLAVEYRWEGKPGNSGIFSRITAPVTPLPKAVEVQLMHGNAGDVLGLQGRKVAGGQERYFEILKHKLAGDITGVKKLSDQERSPGEWNQVDILAKGGNYKVWVNGTLVNDVQGVEAVRGSVGVQSEGGVIQFRRVTLTPLD